ncbi:hypothetical protein [Agrobacterium pusense]|uniref:hypothetical protein n=1 Tax=Agrobacterium pusense TaxID=648995 RepID=UPI000D1BEE01|nr:hypothetical protein [Agrobacterium pusense]
MECNFTVGQKVVRIGGNARPNVPAVWPEIGKVYTVRGINVWDYGVLLHLHEIDNSHMVPEYSRIEPGFQAQFFRPVIERKTDISIFTDMLIEQKQPVQA